MSALDELIGDSPSVRAVRDKVGRLLSRPSGTRRLPPVLLQGETGTGKGLLARAIHRAGPRAAAPFVDVNCAAIPETLLEAEMFGYERGAFTDARQAKRGLFQAAHHGTLFLDEIGLLPEGLQAKLLKVIEERVVRRLGSTQGEPVDVWVVAATSTDLPVAVREHRFREDLYHRLAVLTVWLPPLRERGDDVLTLAAHLLGRACADYGLEPMSLAADARSALLTYGWPGNVRELSNVMERVALLAEEPRVTAAMLGLPEAAPAGAPVRTGAREAVPLAEAVDSVERAHLLDALRDTSWNVTRAAARLGVSRNTLRYRIEKHGLQPGVPPPPARRLAPGAETAAPAPEALPAVAPTPPPSAVRWERRRLTVLRATLASGTGEAAPLEASRALEVVVDKVRSFGGRVEALSPSAVVAVFGLLPVEDAPRRAAHAAMAMQRAAEGGWGGVAGAATAGVTVGIHVSQFMIGRIGDGAQIAEEAKREAWEALETLLRDTEPGGILATPAAAVFLERRFDLVVVEPGASPEAWAYRLARRERAEFDPGPRLARFVGRQRELDLLRSLLASARAGQGQVVGIVGEPGIGKSRLLFEFRQGLADEPVTYLEAHCFEYGSAIPYLPVLDVLRQNCGILESDRPESIVAKVRAGLEGVGMVAEEGAPYLLHLLGVEEGTARLDVLSPEALKGRAFDTLRRLTLQGSRRRPLVFGIEDLQWIDSVSEELIASLVESLAGAPVLFVATYRPGYRPPWMERSYVTQVAVGPLSPGDSLSVLHSVLRVDQIPEPLARTVLDKAQGNPFFLEELARTLGERHDLHPALGVPDTVQEALLARIDRLPDAPKRLLQAASVLGREVPSRLLREMWPEPGGVDPHLRELTRQEVLREEVGGEDPVYVFKHALTQEVVYGSLLEGQRGRDHGAAGAALEKLYAGRTGEVVERLAYHFGRSDESAKAVDYALLAAEKAQQRWANAEALAYFDAALRRLDTMPGEAANHLRRIDAVVRQAEAAFALGRHAEHIQALEGIRDLVESVADPRRRAAWHYWTGFLHSLTGGRPELAIAHCREASDIADAAGHEDIRAFADCCLAQAYTVAGALWPAVESGDRALALFETRGNVWWACRTLWHLSAAANALGEWARGFEYCRRALDHGQAVNDLRLKVVGLWRTGSTHMQCGDPAAALRCYDTALALSPIPFDAAMIKAVQGYALVKLGRVAPGTAQLEEAVAWFHQSRLRYTHSSFRLRLAEAYLRSGERGRARALLEDALTAARELGYRHHEGVAGRLLGAALAPDEPAAAVSHLETAARLLEEVGARDELARAWVTRAELLGLADDAAAARALLERALAVFEALGTLDEPARVRAALATV